MNVQCRPSLCTHLTDNRDGQGNRSAGTAEGGKAIAGRPEQLERSQREHAQGPAVQSSPVDDFPERRRVQRQSEPLEVRQNIANISVFVMHQTISMQTEPDPAKLKALIDINCNSAAGPAGRARAGSPLARLQFSSRQVGRERARRGIFLVERMEIGAAAQRRVIWKLLDHLAG